MDSACYDLLASEACLSSFLAVAHGDAHRRHWFQLGRHFVKAAGRIGLISWGGSMFEYLMPRLMLRTLPGTLLAEADRTAVARHIEYGRELGIPWGISESSYQPQSPDGAYHYQAFGVPGLGLKQGIEDDQVVAPYATFLAAMLAPHEAIRNLRRLTQAGAEGTVRHVRGRRLHAETANQGKALDRREIVHGAPPGYEPGRACQCSPRRRDAAPVSRDTRGRRDGSPAARAASGRSLDRRDRAGTSAASRASRRDSRPDPSLEPPGQDAGHAGAADEPAIQLRSIML